ncbi:unnamed protein product [Darwinula stevensoni]|uniref:Probable prefoldin subunit 6 n=1 Tax=Darwinula stevensoni TaxID=69355 RepID=A0A7R8XAS8_9CRUS|nr:unnamed protein product [Darwinula stevensoni]CAG0884085.1 unnamed protein product [Darwinula stevensoni]
MNEAIQKKFQQEVERLKGLQKDSQKIIQSRQQLDAQLNENTLVLEELQKLESDANVFKLIGPVLVKQDTEEAKQNVQKRIEYIQGELKHCDTTLKDLNEKQESHKESIGKLQQQMQQMQVKAAMKA